MANLYSKINAQGNYDITILDIPKEIYKEDNDDYISRCLTIITLFEIKRRNGEVKLTQCEKLFHLFGVIYHMDETHKKQSLLHSIIGILLELKDIDGCKNIMAKPFKGDFYTCVELKTLNSMSGHFYNYGGFTILTLSDYNMMKLNKILENNSEYSNFNPSKKLDEIVNNIGLFEVTDLYKIVKFFYFKAIDKKDKVYCDFLFKDDIFKMILKPCYIDYFFGKKKIDVVIYV